MRKIIFLSLLFGAFTIQGQNSVGSAYSMFGIGELKTPVSVQSAGMGFTSIGMSNPNFVNTVNPAANAVVGGYFSHVFDVGIYMYNTQMKTNSTTENVGNGGLSQLSYWFRFNNRWTGLIGLSNFSDVGYNIIDNNVLVSNNNEYSVNYQGSGGLSNIYFSNSLLITKNLSLGAKFSFVFGNIFKNEIATSAQGSSAFNVENSVHIKQLNADFGLNYLISRPKHQFNIGLIYDNGTHMNGNTESSISSSDLDIIYDEIEYTNDYFLPQKVGFGTSFRNQKILVGTDIEFRQWSKATIADEQDLNDTWRYSLGLEFTPDFQSQEFAKRLSFRTGAYVENSYLDIGNTSFYRWGITAGLGVPMPNSGSTINISYHRKYNGTLKNDLIYESTNEFTLNVSIRERWFARSKYH